MWDTTSDNRRDLDTWMGPSSQSAPRPAPSQGASVQSPAGQGQPSQLAQSGQTISSLGRGMSGDSNLAPQAQSDVSGALVTGDEPRDVTMTTGRHAEREAATKTPLHPRYRERSPANPSDPTGGGQVMNEEQRRQYEVEQAIGFQKLILPNLLEEM